jgi:hypothetical protein
MLTDPVREDQCIHAPERCGERANGGPDAVGEYVEG